MTSILHRFPLVLFVSLFALAGCRTAYYSFWETFGKEKRDLLRANVESARDEQQQAREQFQDALTQLKALYGFEGGELEETYDRFQGEYEQCADQAEEVRERIEKVESIAGDLFEEWETEMETISNSNLRASSRRQLNETRQQFANLLESLKRAEQSMGPVLTQFRDQVLYLKHNLNAQAIGSLRGEAKAIEAEIEKLIEEMNASIAEAEKFIKGME